MNEANCRTRNGALFSDSSVERILRDTSAKGIYQTNQNGKTKEIKIEPIISQELWEQVNAILNQEKKPLKRAVRLFAGLVFCQCGGRMSVPSNSPKYICQTCRHKIGTDDLEAIFQEQLKKFPFPSSENKSETLFDYWLDLVREEKRIIIEQLAERITIGTGDIQIEFGISPNSLKTMAFGQQAKKISIEQEKPTKPIEIIQEEKPQQPSFNEPLMSEIEAAKFLGISRMTLLRRRNAGEIGFFRVGFRVLYSKEKHLLPFLEKCEQEADKE